MHLEHEYLQFLFLDHNFVLDKKNRVKVSVIFRGRELAYVDAGLDLLKRVAEEVAEQGTVDQPPKREGWHVSMVLVPK